MYEAKDIAILFKKDIEKSSSLVSRNICVVGKRTSVRLEPEMWAALRDIAKREKCSVHEICTLIYLRKKTNSTLTASIRVFIMLYFKAAATEEGHLNADHGNFEKMKIRAKITGNIKALRFNDTGSFTRIESA